MLKKYKKTMILTSILLLLPVAAGLLLWNHLPEQMPIHWNASGEVDGWGSRAMAVLVLPLILLVTHWFCLFMTAVDPKNRNQGQKPVVLVLWICPILSLFVSGMTYAASLGCNFNMNYFVLPLVGLLLVFVGNYLPKCRRNYTIGIKLPWTLHDEENWNRTHRFAGRLWIVGGILMMAAAFLPGKWLEMLILPLILLLAFVPTVYSYLLYRSRTASESETAEEEQM